MKKIQLIGLVALILLTGLVFWQMQAENDEPAEPEALLIGLEDNLGEVNLVKVSVGDDTATLALLDDNWVIEEKADYPADFEKLLELLKGLAEADRSNPKTAKADRHADLGLTTDGVIVEVETRSGDFYEVILGNNSQHTGGTFVRLADGDQTWLLNKSLSADSSAAEWLDKTIINLEPDSIQKVEMLSAEGELLTVERSEEGDGFVVRALPPDSTLRYGTVADTLSRALVNVRSDDVMMVDAEDVADAADAEDATEAKSAWAEGYSRATFTRSNGDIIYADTKMIDDSPWLRLTFELQDGSDIAEYQQKEKWQYEISSYAYDSLNKTMDDMVEPPEEESEDDEE